MNTNLWSLIATVFQKRKTIQGYAPSKGSHIHRKYGSRPIKKRCRIDTTNTTHH